MSWWRIDCCYGHDGGLGSSVVRIDVSINRPKDFGTGGATRGACEEERAAGVAARGGRRAAARASQGGFEPTDQSAGAQVHNVMTLWPAASAAAAAVLPLSAGMTLQMMAPGHPGFVSRAFTADVCFASLWSLSWRCRTPCRQRSHFCGLCVQVVHPALDQEPGVRGHEPDYSTLKCWG